MNSELDAGRVSSRGSYHAAHITGSVAAIAVTAVLLVAKLGGYLPASMSVPRIIAFPILAYGFVAGGMLWKLGRAIKRSKAADEGATLPVARHSPMTSVGTE